MNQSESLIQSIYNKYGIKYKIEEKLGRSCFLLNDLSSGEEKILKFSPPVMSKAHKIWRLVMNGSLPFQNEFRLLDQISEYKGLQFKTPKISIKEQDKFYVAEFVKSKNIKSIEDLDITLKVQIASSIFDLRQLKRVKKWFFVKEKIFRMMESPSLKSCRYLIKIRRQFKIKTNSILWLILKLEFKRWISKPKIQPGLIHNDLAFNNIIINEDNELFLIDLEDAIFERKWPLLDVFVLALNIEIGDLDTIIIKSYYENLVSENPDIHSSVIKNNFVYCYLHSLLRAINLSFINDDNKKVLIQKLSWFTSGSEVQSNWFNHIIKDNTNG